MQILKKVYKHSNSSGHYANHVYTINRGTSATKAVASAINWKPVDFQIEILRWVSNMGFATAYVFHFGDNKCGSTIF